MSTDKSDSDLIDEVMGHLEISNVNVPGFTLRYEASLKDRATDVIDAVRRHDERPDPKKIDICDPASLEGAAKLVADLRRDILGDGDMAGSGVMAEPHLKIAMALLEQAAANLELASYHQAQSNAVKW